MHLLLHLVKNVMLHKDKYMLECLHLDSFMSQVNVLMLLQEVDFDFSCNLESSQIIFILNDTFLFCFQRTPSEF